jgi:hypothetical protein
MKQYFRLYQELSMHAKSQYLAAQPSTHSLLATKGIGYMFGPESTRHHLNDWIYNAAQRYKNFRLIETSRSRFRLNGVVMDNSVTNKKLERISQVLELL